jgi:hypothetical protein
VDQVFVALNARETLDVSLSVAAPLGQASSSNGKSAFYPRIVESFDEAGLNPAIVESLILKLLLNVGMASGRRVAAELGLPFGPFPDFLRGLKNQQILAYANSASASDYIYSLTDTGRARARMYQEECAYVGPAPVPFDDYLESVALQTITNEHPKEDDLRRAFADLLIGEETFRLLGPAITRCCGTNIWIPRVIQAEGQIIKLFDMANHEPVETEQSDSLLSDADHDHRWVQIKRPTIVAGGELQMDDLEIHSDPVTKISEAPLQMKSNLGTFLIDDFGRQRMQPVELLNRWIVPLEKRYDFLSLASGKKIRVPFDQLIIFSTNLEPRQLVDEAFLRRIPYKVQAADPTEDMFRKMIAMFGPKLGFKEVDKAAFDHLIDRHYRKTSRPFRCCHPRDLLLQVRNYCIYNDVALELKPEYFDMAVANYFTMA